MNLSTATQVQLGSLLATEVWLGANKVWPLVSTPAVPDQTLLYNGSNVLLVGGGGSGGGNFGGGAGAGQYKLNAEAFTTGQTYTITIGAGATSVANGSDSTITGPGLSITAIGGASSPSYDQSGYPQGKYGGCGSGGAAWNVITGANVNGGAGALTAGGTGWNVNAQGGCGGGGGVSRNGFDATATAAGNGGHGFPILWPITSNLIGETVDNRIWFGGGGGGGGYVATRGTGGIGGGGIGGLNPSTFASSGKVSSGSGGGGGGGAYVSRHGFGGSGFAIIAQPSTRSYTVIAGTPEIVTSGGSRFFIFTGLSQIRFNS